MNGDIYKAWNRELRNYESQTINEFTRKDGINVKFSRYSNGLHWLYTKGNHSLSVILHSGSYGREQGLFETMCSWKPDVQGFLTFGQVQQKINTLSKK